MLSSPPPQTLPFHLCECTTTQLGAPTRFMGIFADYSILFAFSNQSPSPRTFISFHFFATSAIPHLVHSFFLLSSQRSLPTVLPADTFSPLPTLSHVFQWSWKNAGRITLFLSWNSCSFGALFVFSMCCRFLLDMEGTKFPSSSFPSQSVLPPSLITNSFWMNHIGPCLLAFEECFLSRMPSPILLFLTFWKLSLGITSSSMHFALHPHLCPHCTYLRNFLFLLLDHEQG